MSVIGVISDTHGLLRPEAGTALRGAEMILHAGDIGKPEILEELSKIAPVTAVRGNNDTGDWARNIPDFQRLEIGGISIYMLHDLKEFNYADETIDADVLIFGHSHKSMIEERDGVLHLNPGSAGPRRFKLPVTIALLNVEAQVSAEIIPLL
jgi:uncharacterized protein